MTHIKLPTPLQPRIHTTTTQHGLGPNLDTFSSQYKSKLFHDSYMRKLALAFQAGTEENVSLS